MSADNPLSVTLCDVPVALLATVCDSADPAAPKRTCPVVDSSVVQATDVVVAAVVTPVTVTTGAVVSATGPLVVVNVAAAVLRLLPAASTAVITYVYVVFAVNPVRFTACEVLPVLATVEPSSLVAPYSTADDAGSLVAHDTLADVEEGCTAVPETTGAVVSGGGGGAPPSSGSTGAATSKT